MAVPEVTVLPDDVFMTDRDGPVPLYYQLSSRIEAAIRSGMLPPGSRLENELDLGIRLGLSRPTVRRAIQELVDKGLLVRRRGVGTQVVHGGMTRQVELTSLWDDLERSGKRPTTRLLAHGIVPADGRVAESLGVGPGSPVLHVRRLRYADATPLSILENYLPASFGDLTSELLADHGLYQLLRLRGITVRVAKQRIGARRSTAEEARLLEVQQPAPVLTMRRTAYDASGHAVEYGDHCYRPDLYSFETTLVGR